MSARTEDYSGKYVFKKSLRATGPDVFPLLKTAGKKPAASRTAYRIFFTGIGITHADYLHNDELIYGKSNVERINEALKKHVDSLGEGVEYVPRLFWGAVSRRDVLPFLQSLQEADEHDICIIYYYGIGLANPVLEKGFLDLLFSNDAVEGPQAAISPGEDINSYLKRVTENISTNIVVIADLVRSVMLSNNTVEQQFPETGNSSVIYIQNCSPHKVRPVGAEEAIFPDNNIFSDTLIGLLEAGGFQYNYKEFFERIVLRMSQSEETRRPKLAAFPEESLQNRIFSTRKKSEASYKVFFDPVKSQWRLNAGWQQGIRNSLPFIQTIFRLPDGSEVIVQKTEADLSLVSSPKTYTNGELDATLVQQSFPKIKIAFSASINAEQKNQLLNVFGSVELLLIEITEEIQKARFVIHTIDDGFVLIRSTDEQENFRMKPLFRPQSDPALFIQEIEAIAKWQGILELENPGSKFTDRSLSVRFDIVEGFPYDDTIDHSPATAEVTDPDRVILHYIRPEQEWIAPAFRCRVFVNTEEIVSASNKVNQSRNIGEREPQSLYINQLYLGNQFAIGGDQFSLEMTTDGSYSELQFLPHTQSAKRRTIPVAITDKQVSNDIFETYNYLKIFISEGPIDLKPLWQNPLKENDDPGSALSNKNNQAESIRFPNAGWHSITIPIKITYGQKEDIYR